MEARAFLIENSYLSTFIMAALNEKGIKPLFDSRWMAVNTVLCEGEEKTGSKKRALQ